MGKLIESDQAAQASGPDLASIMERISSLSAQNRAGLDTDTLIRLRDLRVKAGLTHLVDRAERHETPCPPLVADPFPGLRNAIPEIDAGELTLDKLAGGIRHHGALIVRGFANSEFAAQMRAQIDQVLDACRLFFESDGQTKGGDVRKTSGHSPKWFAPSEEVAGSFKPIEIKFMRQTGSVYTQLSPMAANTLSEFFIAAGLKKMLADYFQDEPCISFKKSVLRRVEPLKGLADWHQDGAFMTKDIKSLNLWIALTECGAGTDSPGMDLIPKRLSDIVETGTNGANFKWSVSHASVDELFKDCPPERPHFGVGDAIFFDHLNLHVTSFDKAFKTPRYAIETWFFASSYNAANQIPVLL